MKSDTKLSVITINFNDRAGLKRTIESVVAQTTRDFQYIVIDGGSTDGSVDVIKEYQQYIDYWVSEPDKGIYNAMNKGIAKATGEYCNFLNSGDFYYSDNVIEQFIALDPSEDIIAGRHILCENDLILKDNIGCPPPLEKLNTDYWFSLTINHQSCFIKTALLKENPYDESLKIVSDWKFFLQEFLNNKRTYKAIDLIVACYDATGISSINIKRREEERTKVLYSLFSKQVVDDYFSFLYGRNKLEKMIHYSNPNGFICNLLYKLGLLLSKFQ